MRRGWPHPGLSKQRHPPHPPLPPHPQPRSALRGCSPRWAPGCGREASAYQTDRCQATSPAPLKTSSSSAVLASGHAVPAVDGETDSGPNRARQAPGSSALRVSKGRQDSHCQGCSLGLSPALKQSVARSLSEQGGRPGTAGRGGPCLSSRRFQAAQRKGARFPGGRTVPVSPNGWPQCPPPVARPCPPPVNVLLSSCLFHLSSLPLGHSWLCTKPGPAHSSPPRPSAIVQPAAQASLARARAPGRAFGQPCGGWGGSSLPTTVALLPVPSLPPGKWRREGAARGRGGGRKEGTSGLAVTTCGRPAPGGRRGAGRGLAGGVGSPAPPGGPHGSGGAPGRAARPHWPATQRPGSYREQPRRKEEVKNQQGGRCDKGNPSPAVWDPGRSSRRNKGFRAGAGASRAAPRTLRREDRARPVTLWKRSGPSFHFIIE